MLSTPDFREKQVVFLNAAHLGFTQLSFRNENIVITRKSKTHDKVPLRHLMAIFIFGETTLTTRLIAQCMQNGISLFLLTRNLRTYATIGAYAEGNYLLRQKQYALNANDAFAIARHIVANKLVNQLALLRSIGIQHIRTQTRMQYKKDMIAAMGNAKDLATLRGIEGAIGRDFFAAYFADIGWRRRIPRGREDPNNILLDMGYSMLFNFIDSLLRIYGFDTYKGIYHQLYFQRKSLSCDIMEPFRCVIDRALYKMHTLKQFDKKDFKVAKGKYYLAFDKSDKYARIFLTEIMRYKMDMHAYVRSLYYHIINDGEEKVYSFVIR